MQWRLFREGVGQPPLFHYYLTTDGRIVRMRPPARSLGVRRVVLEGGEPFPSRAQTARILYLLVRTRGQLYLAFPFPLA